MIRSQHAMNLAELAQVVAADRNLCSIVTETACQEFGCARLGVPDAIVLLGRERLCALLAISNLGRSGRKIRRAIRRNSDTPSANLHMLETLKGEPK